MAKRKPSLTGTGKLPMDTEKLCLSCDGRGYMWNITKSIVSLPYTRHEEQRTVTRYSYEAGETCKVCNGHGMVPAKVSWLGWLLMVLFGLLIGVVLIGQF